VFKKLHDHKEVRQQTENIGWLCLGATVLDEEDAMVVYFLKDL